MHENRFRQHSQADSKTGSEPQKPAYPGGQHSCIEACGEQLETPTEKLYQIRPLALRQI